MVPLQAAAAAGFAVVVLWHERKSGGDVSDAGRGSSAFAGAADILLTLRRANTPGHESRRELSGVGRFDGVPESLVIEFRDGEYVVVGDRLDVERDDMRWALLDRLPLDEAHAATEAELLEAMGDLGSRSTLRRALEDLARDGLVVRRRGFGPSSRAIGFWRNEVEK